MFPTDKDLDRIEGHWYASKMAKIAFVLAHQGDLTKESVMTTPSDLLAIRVMYKIAQGEIDSSEDFVLRLMERRTRIWDGFDISYTLSNYQRVLS